MKFLKLWSVVLLLSPFLSHGQATWTTIRFDLNLSFRVPSMHTKKDTLGQQIINAQIDFASLQVAKVPQPEAQIKNKKDLVDYYRAFQKATLEQGNGTLVSDSTIEMDGLYVQVFKFESDWHDSLKVQENISVFIDSSMYLFSYAYFKDKEQLAKIDKRRFFAGISFHDTDFNDQLTVEQNKEETAVLVGYIFRYVIIAAVLLALVLFFLKKYQLVKSILNILSLSLLSWGAVCLVFYIGNLFQSKTVDSLLMVGVICLIVGFALRKIKLPQTK